MGQRHWSVIYFPKALTNFFLTLVLSKCIFWSKCKLRFSSLFHYNHILWLWFVAPHCVMYCTWCPHFVTVQCKVYCIINRILQLAQNCLIGECEMTAYLFVSSGLFLIFGYASVSSIWSSWLVASFRTSISLRLADKVCWRKSTKRGQINSTGEQSYTTSLKIFWIYG